jgi:3-oxoisoapionate decarboxylase
MKLGINTYTYMWSIGFEGARPEKPMNALDILQKACDLGVKVLQLGPNLPLDHLEGGLERLRRAACAAGIELELGTRGLEPDHLRNQIARCEQLGANLLRTIPELNGQTPTLAEIRACLANVVPLLESRGIRLALENGKIPARYLASVVEQVGSASVGVVLDTANSLAIHEGWKYVAEILAPHTMCLHLKEVVMKRVWYMMGFICEGRPTGQGQLDIPWLLKTCRQSRHDFNVILELWPPEQETLEETIRLEQSWAVESVAFMRQYISE